MPPQLSNTVTGAPLANNFCNFLKKNDHFTQELAARVETNIVKVSTFLSGLFFLSSHNAFCHFAHIQMITTLPLRNKSPPLFRMWSAVVCFKHRQAIEGENNESHMRK